MIEIDLDKILKRRKDTLTDLATNALAKAALALGMVDRDVPALVAEIVRLNNEVIAAWDEGFTAADTTSGMYEGAEARLARINAAVQEAYASGDYREALASIEGIIENPEPPTTS